MSDPVTESQSTTNGAPPTSTSTTEETIEATLPGYRRPEATSEQEQLDEAFDGEHTGLGPRRTRSTPASSRRGFPRASEVFERVLKQVGKFLHRRLTPGDAQAIWLADEQDLAEIVEPAAAIVDRHVRIGDGVLANDVVDGFCVALGVAGYVDKNVDRMKAYGQAWLQQTEQDAST